MGTGYLEFTDVSVDGRKTRSVNVVSLRSGDVLGMIRWFGRWRQYAFFPSPGSIWNPECLDEVNGHIRDLMEARRAARR